MQLAPGKPRAMQAIATGLISNLRSSSDHGLNDDSITSSRFARLILVGSLLFFALVHLPFIPVEFYSDEGDNLVGGWLMSEGQVIYRDYFSQHTPFGHFYAAVTNYLFGRNWVIHRYSLALLGLVCLGYALCRLIKSPDKTFFYAIVLFTVLWPVYSVLYWGYMLLNDNLAAYPYLLCFVLIVNAVWNRVPLSLADNLVLGVAAYVAVMSNPFTLFPALALAPLYLYALFVARRPEAPAMSSIGWPLMGALAGCGVPLALTAGFFAVHGILSDAWYWMVTFNQTIYTQYHGCPSSIWPELQHQLSTVLDLRGDVRWIRRTFFARPMDGCIDDVWIYLGLAGRVAILALCLFWFTARKKLLAITIFFFAATSLLRWNMGIHVQHFRMLELLAEMLLLVPCLQILIQSTWWRRSLVLVPAGVLVAVQVIVVSRSLASLYHIHKQHPIRLTLHPSGLPMTGGGDHLKDLIGGEGNLLAYPVFYQFNFMSGHKPPSYFHACVPWTLHRPEDKQRLLDDVQRAAGENTVIFLDHCGTVWNFPFADIAGELIDAVDRDYVEIEPSIHVSRSNPNSRRKPLLKHPVSPVPSELKDMIWSGNQGEGIGEHPRATFSLNQPDLIYRIQLRFVMQTPDGQPTQFRAWWRKRGDNDFEGAGRRSFEITQPSRAEEHVLCLPVGEVIDQLRIEPAAGPCRFEIRRISAVK